MIRTALLALVVFGASAQADVWKRAIEGDDGSRETYDEALRAGDDAVLQANSQSASKYEIKKAVDKAIALYRKAAAARPKAGEPYFRIATTLYSFYLESCPDPSYIGFVSPSPLRDCANPNAINVKVAEDTIAAWNAFEAREPLDPRLGVDGGILFSRAILHTKLATKAHFEAAVKDYERYLDRSDNSEVEETSRAWGNLAETYMMLGKLDEAIEAYAQAVRGSSDASTAYGFAVALDRDERTSQALSLIVRQGTESYEGFRRRIEVGDTFFVPEGEVYYYYALIDEAFGNIARSIKYWRMYIASGAHKQYQPRAKAHLDALLKQKPRPAPRPFEDDF